MTRVPFTYSAYSSAFYNVGVNFRCLVSLPKSPKLKNTPKMTCLQYSQPAVEAERIAQFNYSETCLRRPLSKGPYNDSSARDRTTTAQQGTVQRQLSKGPYKCGRTVPIVRVVSLSRVIGLEMTCISLGFSGPLGQVVALTGYTVKPV